MILKDTNVLEPFLPAYAGEFDPRKAFAIGNRDIGLMFGSRNRFALVWQMHMTVKDEVVLHDENGVDYILGTIKGIKNLSFVFNPFAFPIVAAEVERDDFTGVELYQYSGYGGEKSNETLLLSLPNCRCPKLVPTNISDLGSILNQPELIYIDDTGSVLTRSGRTNFAVESSVPLLLDLVDTDELRRSGITTTGKVQIEISRLKEVL